jgi:GH15 family glucan-1,4-alpha-glucosidase
VTIHRRRISGALLAVCICLPLLATRPPARAQTTASCQSNNGTPERFGPTDISAASGNGRLSVGLNDKATVTVFKWPSPSYYDQIKYRTRSRSQPRMGALENEGAFLGIAWAPFTSDDPERKWGFNWLRDWSATQRFSNENSDEVITTFRRKKLGLTVTVRDVVAADQSALVRTVRVRRTDGSPVRRARVFSFSNYNPVVTKLRQAPVADWCTEERNDAGAAYIEADDVIAHEQSGMDESTGAATSVALLMGFKGRSKGFHVGPDTYQATRSGTSAYDDAQDGKLSGGGTAAGQADAALFQQVGLKNRKAATSTVILAAGPNYEEARKTIRSLRGLSPKRIRSDKAAWWKRWLRPTQLPKGAPLAVRRLAKRALISIKQATDPDSGMIVTSIATQAPDGTDNIRHAAYINRALNVARHPEMVEKHNRRLADLQSTYTKKPIGGEAVPPGNWAENYYADGVVGGATPYEIDSTGLGIWTLWDHYAQTGNRSYLMSRNVYEAIQLAAHYLSDDAPLGCRDPSSRLQCTAHENGGSSPTRTLAGAQAAWLGLDAAARAARIRGGDALANAKKWEARRDELELAIEQNFFDIECNCYTSDPHVGGPLLWPVGLVDPGSSVARAQAERNWLPLQQAMNGKAGVGGLEARTLAGNAHVWIHTAAGARRLREGLRWVATKPTTPGTRLLGGAWMIYPSEEEGEMTTMLSQPHVWSQAMFYLAAIQTYGATGWTQ